MADRLQRMLEDQRMFNRQVFTFTEEPLARMIRLKDLVLGQIEESLEFIRTFDFKPHRKLTRFHNKAHAHEELIDQFKYWLSCADLVDFPMDQLEEMYFAKSRVVQYRLQEEWLKEIDPKQAVVVVDIDEVLADYITGMCNFAKEWAPKILNLSNPDALRLAGRLTYMKEVREFVSHGTVGIAKEDWAKIKHEFRIRGGKRTLPVFDDAKPFLEWIRRNGWLIVLVTSRPIDRYPNIFTDTLAWLNDNNLPYDFVWWATDKTERLESSIQSSQVVFAVDDHPTFVGQFKSKGIRTFWLRRNRATIGEADEVQSLSEIVTAMKEQSHVI